MGIFFGKYDKPGPGINKDEPPKKGIALFFSILLREFWVLIQLNLLFLLYSLPVITIVPSFIAMTKMTMKMVWDEPVFLYHEFKKSFKENLKNGIFIEIIVALISVIFFISGRFYFVNADQNIYFRIGLYMIFSLAFIFMLGQTFLYPLISTIDLPLKNIIKNAFLLSTICLGRSLATLVTTAAITAVVILFMPYTFILAVTLLFSVNSFVMSFYSWGGIKKYVIDSNSQESK